MAPGKHRRQAGVSRHVKLRAAILVLTFASPGRADLTVPATPRGDPNGAFEPRVQPALPPVAQEDDDEPTDPGAQARVQCAPLLQAAGRALRRGGAIEISPVDGRSLLASFFLRGRQARSPSLSVEVRVDCMRRPRSDGPWSASDSYFERQVGRLQASFIIPPRSQANAFLQQVETSLDRVLASTR